MRMFAAVYVKINTTDLLFIPKIFARGFFRPTPRALVRVRQPYKWLTTAWARLCQSGYE
jgi:hypothetical protein